MSANALLEDVFADIRLEHRGVVPVHRHHAYACCTIFTFDLLPPSLTVNCTPTVNDEHMNLLQFLCPEAAGGAAEILDHRTVMRFVARQSRREFYAIDAKARRTHCMLPGFCTCCAFCYQVAAKPEALVCKHELAVRIADATGQLQTSEVDDDEWATQFSLAMALPMTAYS